MPTESQIQAVALALATAYWQGMLAKRRPVRVGSLLVLEDIEGMIQRTAANEARTWMEKARKAMEEEAT